MSPRQLPDTERDRAAWTHLSVWTLLASRLSRCRLQPGGLPHPRPRQPSSQQLPQPLLHPTSVLSPTPLSPTYLGHIVFHLIQVSVFQGPHELLIAHHCSGAGRLAGQKTRRRWQQQADTAGRAGDRAARSRSEEKAGWAGRRARQLAAATVGAGVRKFSAATGPGRAGSAWPKRSWSACTSGSLPARALPQLPLPLPLGGTPRSGPRPEGPRPSAARAQAQWLGRLAKIAGGGVGGSGRPNKGVGGQEGQKPCGGRFRVFQRGSGRFCAP